MDIKFEVLESELRLRMEGDVSYNELLGYLTVLMYCTDKKPEDSQDLNSIEHFLITEYDGELHGIREIGLEIILRMRVEGPMKNIKCSSVMDHAMGLQCAVDSNQRSILDFVVPGVN